MADPVKLEILPEGGLGNRAQVTKVSERSESALLKTEGGGKNFNIDDLKNNTAIAHLNLNFKGEYLRPKVDEAIRYRKRHHPTRQDGSSYRFCGTHSSAYGCNFIFGESDLRDYGSGISNYFKWLKYLATMLFILSVFGTPPLLFNTFAGSYYNDSPFPIAATTLGNLWDRNASIAVGIFASQNSNDSYLNDYNTTTKVYELRLPGLCNEEGIANGHCKVQRDEMLFNYALADAFGTLIFWLSLFIVNRYIRIEDRLFKKKVLKVEDFSVQVSGLPDDCTPSQVRDHFLGLKQGNVWDVQMVESTGNAIELCVRRGRLMKSLARQDGKVRRLNREINEITTMIHDPKLDATGLKPGRLSKLEKQVKYAKNKFDKIYHSIKELDDKAVNSPKGTGKALLAFVTFDKQLTRANVLELYNSSFHCNQPEQLRLGGSRVRVSPAPPPSTLLWENTDVTAWARRRRIALAVVVLLLLLVVTAVISYAADEYRAFADFAVSITTKGDSVCDGVYDELNVTEAIMFGQENEDETYGINCLCSNEVTISKALYPEYNNLFFSLQGACKDYLLTRATQFGTETIISVAVLVMNAVINVIILFAAKYMRFRSIVDREGAILKLVFVITFINTALIILAVNADVEYLLGIDLPLDGILGTGQFSDMEALWYRNVGVEIIFVAMLNIFAPHALQFSKLLWHKFRMSRKAAQSQSELNDQYLGPEFALSFRYAQVLMMMFTVLMYSSGMPVLYPLAFLAVVVTYWIDKYFFLHITRLPPMFTVRLGMWANKALQWAVVIHLGMAIWAYSSPLLFPTSPEDIRYSILSYVGTQTGLPVEDILTDNIGNITANPELDDWLRPYINTLQSRIFKDQSIPLFGLLVVVLLVKFAQMLDVIWMMMNRCVNLTARAVERCLGRDPLSFDHILGFDEANYRMTYQQALDDRRISGIESYNILANPAYAHAFQLVQDEANSTYSSLGESLKLQGVRKPNEVSGSDSSMSTGSGSSGSSSALNVFTGVLQRISTLRTRRAEFQSSRGHPAGTALVSMDEDAPPGMVFSDEPRNYFEMGAHNEYSSVNISDDRLSV